MAPGLFVVQHDSMGPGLGVCLVVGQELGHSAQTKSQTKIRFGLQFVVNVFGGNS